METPSGKTLPYILEEEQAVLGSMILNTDALTKAIESVTQDDFYLEQHKAVFDALLNLFNDRKPIDLITLKDELGDKLDLINGISYLAQLTESVSTTQNIRYYIDIVKEKSVLRKLIEASNYITGMCYDEKNEVSMVLDSYGTADGISEV